MVRAFVASFPPPEVREALHRAALDLPASTRFRLVSPEKIHLTLKFLGDVTDEGLSLATEALQQARGGHEPFEVATSGFGVFPSRRKARILWAGTGEGSGRLRDLAGAVEEALETAGFGREARPYLPHLTLGRARGRPVDVALEASAPTLRFTVSGLDLVSSTQGAAGVTYSVLATFPFRKAGS